MHAILLVTTIFFQQAAPNSGRSNQLDVIIPRIEAVAVIDGMLTDAVWSQAARLTDFSQYQPVDGRFHTRCMGRRVHAGGGLGSITERETQRRSDG